MKYIPFALEGIGLILTILLGVGWYCSTNEYWEPLILLIGIFTGIGVDFVRRFFKFLRKPQTLVIEFSYKQICLARFYSRANTNTNSKKIGITLYYFDIINRTPENITVKGVLLMYEYKDIEYTSEPFSLPTGPSWNDKAPENTAVLSKMRGIFKDTIFLMHWHNVQNEIGKKQIVPPNGVFTASAFYILNFYEMEEILSLKKLRLVIEDYNGRRTEMPISLDSSWISRDYRNIMEVY